MINRQLVGLAPFEVRHCGDTSRLGNRSGYAVAPAGHR
ncbi:hypothetical protein BJY22_000054 [Kribbella shirazensis]|uniref:Uncharacterized protein n=1 Tax=Kribbella shirazensis TaxID=1105143 RepID=A0A7X5V5H9_9ACTN|nr:hypothetical protein [Kribbella shirazensis]